MHYIGFSIAVDADFVNGYFAVSVISRKEKPNCSEVVFCFGSFVPVAKEFRLRPAGSFL